MTFVLVPDHWGEVVFRVKDPSQVSVPLIINLAGSSVDFGGSRGPGNTVVESFHGNSDFLINSLQHFFLSLLFCIVKRAFVKPVQGSGGDERNSTFIRG